MGIQVFLNKFIFPIHATVLHSRENSRPYVLLVLVQLQRKVREGELFEVIFCQSKNVFVINQLGRVTGLGYVYLRGRVFLTLQK